MNMFGLDAELAPLVVDSDPRKVGHFVPGTGQRIEGPAALAREPADVILICTNWRARDIEHEIRAVHGLDADLYVCVDHDVRVLEPGLAL
jgi:hypothetical protein